MQLNKDVVLSSIVIIGLIIFSIKCFYDFKKENYNPLMFKRYEEHEKFNTKRFLLYCLYFLCIFSISDIFIKQITIIASLIILLIVLDILNSRYLLKQFDKKILHHTIYLNVSFLIGILCILYIMVK